MALTMVLSPESQVKSTKHSDK